MTRQLFIKTFGCQMNVYDSAKMADVLAPHGYGLADSVDDADLVILNTCHIREKAAEKLYSDLGRLRIIKTARQALGKDLRIAVAGCVAQAQGDEILSRAPYTDLVVGPQSYQNLPELLAQAEIAGTRPAAVDFPEVSKFDGLADATQSGPAAFLTIQEGCDRFCTFCVVPYTRGAEYSRPVSDVVAEARRLVDLGARELTLLGQNVNAYHGAGDDGGAVSLAGLVRVLAEVPGLDRLRYTTSHPQDMTDDLIAAHGDSPKLMPALHLPVQSGSDRILAAMNRRHRADDYFRTIDALRIARPGMAISSDFIVGFPGETDDEFQATLDLVDHVQFAGAYSFKYSPRPGTPAADLDQVPEAVKTARLDVLQTLLDGQRDSFNRRAVGHTNAVLLERSGRHPGQLIGRTPYNQAIYVDADPDQLGTVVDVKITATKPNSLAGEIVGFKPPTETVMATGGVR
ncbi:MAG: tRNA (N6-isopentenyl adenosine(37)-C2)-methylthiotransferase MiaB [Alphaproteobacteria bacterium]|nr:tRNA (N6-isopentenyl adenosine(37)-C2)-methylthiotransferase MiaB [Alphaproteobacteria bacterium]MBT5860972.1 tRNA (N6-isopentenyl adenosine(37)-C2)-methylthiotransferase MiaB [Alphaproteobacteria bacterium]